MLKNIKFLTLAIFLFSSCAKTANQKAMELVETYCKGNFFYPDTYRSWNFENLEAYYQPYEHTAQYHRFTVEKKRLEHKKDSLMNLMAIIRKPIYNHQIDLIDYAEGRINTIMSISKRNFTGNQEGWTMVHSYYKANDFGAVVEYRTVFVLDKNLTRVVEPEQVSILR